MGNNTYDSRVPGREGKNIVQDSGLQEEVMWLLIVLHALAAAVLIIASALSIQMLANLPYWLGASAIERPAG